MAEPRSVNRRVTTGLPTVVGRLTPRSVRRSRARRRSGLLPSARIFGIGLSRTGTMSLAQALDLLGYRSLHYPKDDLSREEVTAFLASGGEEFRLTVLERYDALSDTPVCATFEALDAAYPGSRFILTVREKQSWLESCRAYWASWVDAYLRARPQDPLPVYIAAIHGRIYGSATFDQERYSRAYDAYHAHVREYFRDRPGDLLTLDISGGEGWESLCGFLGQPIPATLFPKANVFGPPGAEVGARWPSPLRWLSARRSR